MGSEVEGATSGGRVATRIGWLTAALLPPAAAVPFLDSPWIAALVVIGGETGLAAFAFAAQVFGLLRTRWAERLADRIDVAVGTALSRFDKEYRRWVRTGNLLLDQQGLLNVGAYSLELAEVFVDVSLAPRPVHQVDADPLAQSEVPASTTRRSVWEFLERHSDRPARLAIVAGPGCGKSTLVAHVALQLSTRRRNRIPILLALRDHAERIAAEPDISLVQVIRDRLANLPVSEPPQWWERRLAAGRCLVMLDGLDEVGSPERRRAVVAWVTEQMRTYHRNDLVVTSRPYGYQGSPLPGMTTLTVRTFTPDQVKTFVQRWSLAVERRDTGAGSLAEARRSRRERRELDAAVTRRAETAADLLLKRLKDRPELYELTVNPLLLTMIANVHRFKNALPAGRVDLYADICDALLWSRQEAKGITDPLTRDQKATIVQSLAWELMDNQARDASGGYVERTIAKVLPRIAENIDAVTVLRDLTASGLLVEREADTFAFAHHSLQEYLASAFAREQTGDLTNRVTDPWWRETILLYAAKTDATWIAETALESRDGDVLGLAFECLNAEMRIRPDVRARLEQWLASVEEEPLDSVQRYVLTRALVTESLARTVPLESGRRMCLDPVPNQVYRLFLQEVAASGRDREPDLSDGGTPDADGPAVGMRGADAFAFVEWATTHSSDRGLSLPAMAELHDPAVNETLVRRDRSVWAQYDDSGVDLWVPPDRSNPRMPRSEQFRRQLERDFATAHPLIALFVVLVLMRRGLLRALLVARRDLRQPDHSVREILLGLRAADRLAKAMGAPFELARDLPYELIEFDPGVLDTEVPNGGEIGALLSGLLRVSAGELVWKQDVNEEMEGPLDRFVPDLLRMIEEVDISAGSSPDEVGQSGHLWPVFGVLARVIADGITMPVPGPGFEELLADLNHERIDRALDGPEAEILRLFARIDLDERHPSRTALRQARLAAIVLRVASPRSPLRLTLERLVNQAVVLELRLTGEIQPSEVIYLTRD